MGIPLYNRLKKQSHREIAALQDLVVDAVYAAQENAVLHGGTAILRCFQGQRFSEDLDFYFKPKESFKESLGNKLKSLNAEITKFRKTSNAIYAKVKSDRTEISLEIALRSFGKPVASEYEKADGAFIDVFTPTAEELLIEKLSAYKNRKLVRDVFDVYFLSRVVDEKKIREKISGTLKELPRPIDEQNLKNIVISGAVPSFDQMTEKIKARLST